MTDFTSEDSQSEGGSQQSQPLDTENANSVRRKRDLKPLKAMIRFCWTELLDINTINKPSTSSLMKKMSCLRTNSDVSGKTAIEELIRMSDSLEKVIKQSIVNVKTMSVLITKLTIDNEVRKLSLIHI